MQSLTLPKFPRICATSILAATLSLCASARAQTTYYWDSNDSISGFGTAGGTWASPTTNNSTQGWSTSSAGTNVLSGTTNTTTSDALNFGTGSAGLAAGTITVSGTVSANSLTFGSASGAIVLSGGTISLGGTTPTITVSNTSDTISSAIIGSAGLTKNGTGNLTLSGNNTYSGNTTVNAGRLKAGSTTALSSSSAMSVAAGATLDLGGFNNTISSLSTATGTITDSSSAGSGGILKIATAMPGTASAQLFTGSLGLQFYGGGTVNTVLTNTANTYSGGTILGLGSGSTVTRILTASNIGSGTGGNVTSGIFGTGAITIGASATDNSQLYLFNGVTINNNIVVNTSRGNSGVELGAFRFDGVGTMAGSVNANLADAVFNSYGTGNVSVTGAITGNSGLTVMSASTGRNNVTLNNAGTANSYAGNTTINTANATLTLGRADQISNGAGKGNLIINSGTFNMAGYSETINGLSGNGTLDGFSGTPILTIGDNNATSTFSGIVKNTAGTLALTKTGTGILTLSGNNTYSGATTVSGGTLEIGAAGRLGGGNYSANIANSGTFLYSGTNDQILSGQISGVGALTKNGTGVLTLNGVNSYNGTTTVNAGTLKIGNSSGLGNGSTLTVSGGVLDLNGFNASVASLGAGSSLGTITNSAAGSGTSTVTVTNFTTNLATLITDGATAKTGLLFNNNNGVPWLSNANNTFSGGITIANGVANTRMYQLSAVTNTLAGNGTLLKSNFGTGNILIGANGSTAAAQFALTTANTEIYNGIVFNAGSTFGDGGKAAVRVDQSGIKLYGTLTAGASDISFSSASTGSVTAFGQLTGTNGLTLKTSNITLTLTNNSLVTPNDYSGSTTIETSGTLVLGAANQISNGAGKGNLTMNGTFNMGGFSETINGLSGNGAIDGVSGTPTLTVGDNNATSTFSGIVKNTAGTLALTKTGTGTLTLSGNNSYGGTTTLTAGTISMGHANALGTTGNITFSGGALQYGSGITTDISSRLKNGSSAILVDTNGNNIVFASAVDSTNSGGLTINGTGILTLSGANSYTGTTTLNAGTLRIGNNSALGTGNLVVNSATAVIDSAAGTTYTLSNNITLATDGKIGAGTTIGNLTFSGIISGSGNLALNTPNSVTTLNGTNSFSGNLSMVLGQLNVNSVADKLANSALGAGSKIIVGAGGGQGPVLNYTSSSNGSSNRDLELNVLGGGSLTIISQNAVLTLLGTAMNTANGNGILNLSGDAGGGANINHFSGAIQDNGTSTMSVQLLSVTPTGGSGENGFWKLLGNNTYSGTTSVTNAGTLIVAHSNALGTTANGISISANGQLLLEGGVSVGGEALSLNSLAGSNWNGQTLAALRSYTGNNSWAGAITLGQATTIATNSGAGLTLSGGISGNYNLTFNSIGDTTSAGIVAIGTGTLTKNGTGTLTLSGNNTYTGATTVNAGTLVVSGTNTGSAITINSGGSLLSATSIGSTTVNSGGKIAPGASANSVGSLTVAGLTLNGGGTYTWDMANATGAAGTGWDQMASSGLLSVGATSGSKFTIAITSSGIPSNWDYTTTGQTWDIINYGSLSGFAADKFAFDTLAFGGTLTADSSWALSDTGSALRLTYTYTASTPTWTGASGNWSTGFSPALTAGANATFAGLGGTATNNIASGNLTSIGSITFGGTGAYTLQANSGSAGFDAASSLQLNGNIVNNSAATQTINLALTSNTTRVYDAAVGNLTLGSSIAGTGGLTKNGTGTLTLSGNSSYSGATTVNAGTLKAGSSTGLSSVSAMSIGAGAVVDLGGFNSTISSLSSATGTITNSGSTANLTLTSVGSGAAQLFAGNLSLVLNTSTVFTNANSTYSGGTYLNSGRLILGSGAIGVGTPGALTNGQYGTGAITIGNSTASLAQLYLAGDSTGVINNAIVVNSAQGNGPTEMGSFRIAGVGPSIAGAINANLADATFNSLNSGQTVTVTGVISGIAGLTVMTQSSGTLNVTLNNSGTANSYAGNTTISTANATLTLGRSDQIANGAANGNLVINSGTFKMGGFNETINGLSGNGTIDGVSGTPTLTIGDSDATSTFSGVIKNTAGTLALTKTGNGTLSLAGANTFSGSTAISAGNLSISSVSSLGSTSGINLSNATALIYTGGAAALDRSINITTGTGTIRNSGSGLLTLSGGLTKNGTTLTLAGGSSGITVSGVISGSSANSDLTVDGGTVNLTNTNTYNGPTTIINSGTLNANAAGALPTSTLSAVTINGSSTLALGASQSVASLSGTAGSSVTLGSNTLTINGSSTTTYSGAISGTGNLVKNGSGTQTLAGATTYTGATTVNSGTLTATAANALGNSTVINVDGGSFLVTAANAVNDNAAVNLGGGRMAVSGNFDETVGLLTLSANSTIDFSGFAGTLRFGGIGSWASGATLAIWNWSGTTQYGTQINNYATPSNLVFTDNSNLNSNLALMSFYSDSGSSFVGNGFEQGFSPGGGTEIIAVPEPEAFFYAAALLAGIVVQFVRRRAKRKSLELCPQT